MEDLHDGGKVKNIGVSNFNVVLMRDVLSYCRIKPAVNQVEIHPYNTQVTLVKYCKDNGIAITAFSAMGAISYGQADKSCLKDPMVNEIATKLGKDAGQILMRFAVQRGYAVIPKSMNPDRLASNIDLFGWELPEEDMNKLLALN
jgi:diketogulonate reductase-like aldo/keto reductase